MPRELGPGPNGGVLYQREDGTVFEIPAGALGVAQPDPLAGYEVPPPPPGGPPGIPPGMLEQPTPYTPVGPVEGGPPEEVVPPAVPEPLPYATEDTYDGSKLDGRATAEEVFGPDPKVAMPENPPPRVRHGARGAGDLDNLADYYNEQLNQPEQDLKQAGQDVITTGGAANQAQLKADQANAAQEQRAALARADLEDEYANDLDDIMQERDEAIQAQVSRVDLMLEQIENNPPDPNRWMASRSGGQKVALALSAGFSNFLNVTAGKGDAPNQTLAMVERQIERDLQAQQADINNKKFGVSSRMNLLGQMRAHFTDQTDALKMTHAALLRGAAAKAEAEAAKVKGNETAYANMMKNFYALKQQALKVVDSVRKAVIERTGKQFGQKLAAHQAGEGAIQNEANRKHQRSMRALGWARLRQQQKEAERKRMADAIAAMKADQEDPRKRNLKKLGIKVGGSYNVKWRDEKKASENTSKLITAEGNIRDLKYLSTLVGKHERLGAHDRELANQTLARIYSRYVTGPGSQRMSDFDLKEVIAKSMGQMDPNKFFRLTTNKTVMEKFRHALEAEITATKNFIGTETFEGAHGDIDFSEMKDPLIINPASSGEDGVPAKALLDELSQGYKDPQQAKSPEQVAELLAGIEAHVSNPNSSLYGMGLTTPKGFKALNPQAIDEIVNDAVSKTDNPLLQGKIATSGKKIKQHLKKGEKDLAERKRKKAAKEAWERNKSGATWSQVTPSYGKQ